MFGVRKRRLCRVIAAAHRAGRAARLARRLSGDRRLQWSVVSSSRSSSQARYCPRSASPHVAIVTPRVRRGRLRSSALIVPHNGIARTIKPYGLTSKAESTTTKAQVGIGAGTTAYTFAAKKLTRRAIEIREMASKRDADATETVTEPSKSCFVALPISDQDGYAPGHFRLVFDYIIAPACRKAGFTPVRADDVKTTNVIAIERAASNRRERYGNLRRKRTQSQRTL